MTEEDIFVEALGRLESGGDPAAMGDSGWALGRFQWHPAAYWIWEPLPSEYEGRERSWDWAFELAVRHFYRDALLSWSRHHPDQGDAPLDFIAVAFHLHGQIRWDGDDPEYRARFRAREAEVRSGKRG